MGEYLGEESIHNEWENTLVRNPFIMNGGIPW
jgi:hypothetical protein